jgi:hypothetical protein
LAPAARQISRIVVARYPRAAKTREAVSRSRARVFASGEVIGCFKLMLQTLA